MAERVIDCPVCFDTDRCFVEEQETFSSYICFNCGFMSHSQYKIDWEGMKEVLDNSPLLVSELQVEDKERNLIWIPSVVNMGSSGIIYPEGTSNLWHWKFAKVVVIPEEERKNYPVPGTDKFYETRLDVENAKQYGQYEFLEACKDIGVTLDYNKMKK